MGYIRNKLQCITRLVEDKQIRFMILITISDKKYD